MSYKMKNLFYVLALLVTACWCNNAMAVVTLSDEAQKEDADTGVPTELDMFAEEDFFDDPAPKAEPKAAEESKEGATVNPKTETETEAETEAGAGADPINLPETPVVPKIQPKTGVPVESPVTKPQVPVIPEAPAAAEIEAEINNFAAMASNIESASDADLFSQMSDIERQTALLNLELRREKIKNEIEAVKNQRRQALLQEEEKKAQKEKEKIAYEKEQQKILLQEEQKLRELDMAFEKLRQEHLLNSYKNQYLADTQKWISHDAALYKQIEDLKSQNKRDIDSMKDKLVTLRKSALTANGKVQSFINRYNKLFDEQNAQINILKARIVAQEKELEESRKNPFEDGAGGVITLNPDGTIAEVKSEVIIEEKLPNMYEVLEIRGQKGELIAKLKNQSGNSFYVKKGTTLQSGHTIDEIAQTYVRADRDGVKDYLYFAAGGILPRELAVPSANGAEANTDGGTYQMYDMAPTTQSSGFVSSSSIPGIGQSMMVR